MRGKTYVAILSAITLLIVISIVFASGKPEIVARAEKLENNAYLIRLTIEDIDPYPHYAYHYPNVQTHEKEFKTLYSLGVASVPHIMDYIESDATDILKKKMLLVALKYNLHLPTCLELLQIKV